VTTREATPVPAAFTASTRNRYVVPDLRFVTAKLRAHAGRVDTFVHVRPLVDR
jgi:hypothetical protein